MPDAPDDTAAEPDDLPPLPQEVEDELYEILLERPWETHDTAVAQLLSSHPTHRRAISVRVAAMKEGESVLDQARKPLAEPPLPARIANYRIAALLGQGGFGTVYRAEQDEPVRRTVALKVLHALRLDERSRWRFQAERQVLARMQHPHIAQIYDAGSTTAGEHYFAMELVDGEPITAWCDRQRLDLEARIGLFLQVCSAVQHAHQRGVVHRDLKPSNVMVTTAGDHGSAKVIDFGVAKVLEAEEGRSLFTRDGALIGTPEYMSPEQAAGEPVDTRTDVYSLGLLLYELLTGGVPRREGASARPEVRSMTTALRAAGDRLEAIAAHRRTHPIALLRQLRGDLEWIMRRALAPDPEHRYGAVAALAADLERHRRSEPVSAREPAALYVARRFVRRHRVGLAVAAAVVVAVIVGIAGLWWTLGEVDRARRTAVAERHLAERREYGAHITAARAALRSGDAANARYHLEVAPAAHRGWEWRYLQSLSDDSTDSYPAGPTRAATAFWGDGDRLFRVTFDGWLSECTGLLGFGVPLWFCRSFQRLCPDREGGRLFAITDNFLGIQALDLATWRNTRLYTAERHPRRLTDIRALALAPDRRTLAFSDNSGELTLLDVDGLVPPRHLATAGGHAGDMAFTGDGAALVLGTGQGLVESYRTADGSCLGRWQLGQDAVAAIAIDRADGWVLAAVDGKLAKIDLATGALLQRIATDSQLEDLELSPDGGTVYGAGSPAVHVSAWSTATLELVGRFHGASAPIRTIALSAGGRRVASCSSTEIRVWNTRPRRPFLKLATGFHTNDLAIAPDGDAFATANADGRLRIWDAATCALTAQHDLPVYALGCAMTRDTVYVGGSRLLAVDRRTGAVRANVAPKRALGRMFVDPAGRFLAASSSPGGHAMFYRLPQLAPLADLELPVSDRIAFDRARDAFVFAGTDHTLRWVDPVRGDVTTLPIDGAGPSCLAVQDDVLVCGQRHLYVRDRRDAGFSPLGPDADLTAVAIAPDRQRLASATGTALVSLWSRDGAEMLVLDDAAKPVTKLGFVAGGSRLIGLSQIQGSQCFVMVWGAGLEEPAER